MPFVHGHPRHAGWVVGHHRRPSRAGDEQLPLPDPRDPADDPADVAEPVEDPSVDPDPQQTVE